MATSCGGTFNGESFLRTWVQTGGCSAKGGAEALPGLGRPTGVGFAPFHVAEETPTEPENALRDFGPGQLFNVVG